MTETYEELLKELKSIVQKIEDDETSLDESIALYERGALLVKKCEGMLEMAEMKISQLGED
jgi:exodeoxyribonuclease VII small subunit